MKKIVLSCFLVLLFGLSGTALAKVKCLDSDFGIRVVVKGKVKPGKSPGTATTLDFVQTCEESPTNLTVIENSDGDTVTSGHVGVTDECYGIDFFITGDKNYNGVGRTLIIRPEFLSFEDLTFVAVNCSAPFTFPRPSSSADKGDRRRKPK
jgi:hypothetical protein